MKNKEFFKDKLIEIASHNTAVNKHTGEVEACGDMGCGDCLFYGKELKCWNIRKKWLNEEYPKPVLDKGEKMYLEEALRPFKDLIKSVRKEPQYDGQFDDTYERLVVHFKSLNDDNRYSGWYMLPPKFEPGCVYKGMKIYKDYTIEELGLFQDGGSDEE